MRPPFDVLQTNISPLAKLISLVIDFGLGKEHCETICERSDSEEGCEKYNRITIEKIADILATDVEAIKKATEELEDVK